MNEAAAQLVAVLEDYFDDSDLQPAIRQGDTRHKAIVAYRAAIGGRLPPNEARLMRRLLDLSRSEKWQDVRDSQSVAEEWAELLEAKYSGSAGGIPAERRTIPMSFNEAARIMFPGQPVRAHARLIQKMVSDGHDSMPYMKVSDKTGIFDAAKFPKISWSRIAPQMVNLGQVQADLD
jgi:hypothetical protein